MGLLCLDCGGLGHKTDACCDTVLRTWERWWLKYILFAVLPPRDFIGPRLGTPPHPNLVTNSLSFGTTRRPAIGVNAIDVMLGEGSRANKRRATTVEDEELEEVITVRHPGLSTTPVTIPTVIESEPKSKGKRRTKREPKPVLPLQGMLDELTGMPEQVSIRQIVKNNRINMSLIELCAISPLFCREVKKLMTKVPGKKKAKKVTTSDVTMSGAQVQPMANAVNYDINTQFLHSLGTHDKAFRILCTVRVTTNGKTVDVYLEKSHT